MKKIQLALFGLILFVNILPAQELHVDVRARYYPEAWFYEDTTVIRTGVQWQEKEGDNSFSIRVREYVGGNLDSVS